MANPAVTEGLGIEVRNLDGDRPQRFFTSVNPSFQSREEGLSFSHRFLLRSTKIFFNFLVVLRLIHPFARSQEWSFSLQ